MTFNVGDEVCLIPSPSRPRHLREELEGKKLIFRGIIGCGGRHQDVMVELPNSDHHRLDLPPINMDGDPDLSYLVSWNRATPAERMGLARGDQVVLCSSDDLHPKFKDGDIFTFEGGNKEVCQFSREDLPLTSFSLGRFKRYFPPIEKQYEIKASTADSAKEETHLIEIGGVMYRLPQDLLDEHNDFHFMYFDSGCSCHVAPPCSYCTHPGNPLALEEYIVRSGAEPEINESAISNAAMRARDECEPVKWPEPKPEPKTVVSQKNEDLWAAIMARPMRPY